MFTQLLASYSDEFLKLDRLLSAQGLPADSRAIMLTASHAGEGVTTCTLAFALFLARRYRPDDVLVVETNFRGPSFEKIFHQDSGAGLLSVLDGTAQLESAIVRVPNHGISILPAGRSKSTQEHSYEIYLERLGEVLAELRNHFRYILLDCAPVIQFVDSAIIVGAVDAIVLVVEANLTSTEVVDHAIEKLSSGGGKVAGIILNKRQFHIPRWLYRFL